MEKIGYIENNENRVTKRYCQTLDLVNDPEKIALYKKYHQAENIWDIVPQGLRSIGIYDMEIYILGTRLFMIVEAPVDFNWDEAFGKLAQMPGQSDWEAFVGEFQKAPEGASSTEKWQMMEQMFKLSEIKK
ncbi:MAG: L-rhamnose mutarotase [Bacteroidales bacterium]|nr:L-rhamnose mutarotase [Bacteroidales bacterium]